MIQDMGYHKSLWPIKGSHLSEAVKEYAEKSRHLINFLGQEESFGDLCNGRVLTLDDGLRVNAQQEFEVVAKLLASVIGGVLNLTAELNGIRVEEAT